MILTETTPVADAALPVAQFRAHLRLGTGFGEDSLQDAVLLAFLRASLAAIESRTAKALLMRGFRLRLDDWPQQPQLRLPIAPVLAIETFELVDGAGTHSPLDPGLLRLLPDALHPELRPRLGGWPALPGEGHALIDLRAGLAADWDALPPDLAQAVFLLAAHYYEYRQDTQLHAGCMPFGVASLIDRYRPLRLRSGATR